MSKRKGIPPEVYETWGKYIGDEEESPVEPCEDAISREVAIQATTGMSRNTGTHEEYAQTVLSCLPPVNPQEPKTGQFARWVAEEIFDDNWEYNQDAFAEIACRKLAKLGIVREKGDEWELVEPQESEVES